MISRTTRIAISIVCIFAITASVAAAGGVRRYGYKDHGSYWVVIRANSHRVLSGDFIAMKNDALDCGSLVGGWQIKNVPIRSGGFKAETDGTMGDSDRYQLKFRGKLVGDTIRGAVSFRLTSSPGGQECWSGNGKDDSWVPYVAELGVVTGH
jgi:hypothetical protein